ncbi:MAG: hypothetical protein K0R26_1945 [Bacteroidota bacterium]|jgi:hypothetical protein|nr:hypothetical protein [Bacteroidota bacterium]
MKQVYLLISLLLIFIEVKSQNWEWALKTEKFNIKESVIADDGSIYIIGNFQDSCKINNQVFTGTGSQNSLLLKLSGSGTPLWSKLFFGIVSLNAMATENNNVFIAGDFWGRMTGAIIDTAISSDIFIMCLTSSGSVVYYKKEGGTGYEILEDLSVKNGELFITGRYQQGATFSGNNLAYDPVIQTFCARYSSSENLILLKSIRTNQGNSYITGIKAGATGNFYIYGTFMDTVQIGYVDTMVVMYNTPGSENIFEFDSNGTLVNTITGLGSYYSNLLNISSHYNGSYFIALVTLYGCNHCVNGMHIRKFGPSGFAHWAYSYGAGGSYSNPPSPSITPIDLASTDNFSYVIGNYSGGFLMGSDSLQSAGKMFFLKIDHQGNYQFVNGIEHEIYPEHLSNIMDSSVIVTGHYQGNAYLDNHLLSNGVSSSGFIAKYNGSPLATSLNPLSNKSANAIELYTEPNPNSGFAAIYFNLGEGNQGDLIVTDSYGKVVDRIRINSGSNKVDVDYRQYANGVYLLSLINSKGQSVNKKMIIAR